MELTALASLPSPTVGAALHLPFTNSLMDNLNSAACVIVSAFLSAVVIIVDSLQLPHAFLVYVAVSHSSYETFKNLELSYIGQQLSELKAFPNKQWLF